MAHATLSFTITKTPDITLNSSTSSTEEIWDFTTQAGWSQGLTILSVEITETFSNVAGGSSFQSTFIQYQSDPTAPNLEGASKIYIIFGAQDPSPTETVTESAPYPCCTDTSSETFSAADITGDGTLGQFDTRVARNTGSFELDSLSITIDAETPEPAAFGLAGVGLLAIVLASRRPLFSLK